MKIIVDAMSGDHAPQEIVAGADVNVSQDDIAAVHVLGAEGEAAVAEAVLTVLDDDPLVGAVLRRGVRPRTFAAL